MANTFTQIYLHVVFAVKGRQSLIRKEFKEEIFKYITGIVRNKGQKLIAINGMADHLHLLIGMKPDIALSNLIRDIKANSSKFIHERGFVPGRFQWQEGFGAFSHSHSQLGIVIRYIQEQERHHAKKSFKDEYLKLLERFDIHYDDRYVFEWIENNTTATTLNATP